MERKIPSFSLKPAGASKPRAAPAGDIFASAPTPEDEARVQVQTPNRGSRSTEDESVDDTPWLLPGLIVRILNRSLHDGAYHHQIGIVKRIVETYGGEIHLENGDVILLDQEECETVVPAVGQSGMCVRGRWREEGRVRVVSGGREVEVELEEGPRAGHRLLLPLSSVCRHIAIN